MKKLKRIFSVIAIIIIMYSMIFEHFLAYANEPIFVDEDKTILNSSAFYNMGLEAATIPNTVKVIGACAYANNKLKSINIPNSVEVIKEYAFQSNEIKNLEIPSSVKEIEKGAFSQNKLESVKIPNSIEVLEPTIFANNNLKEIEIPSSVKLISIQCFDRNEDLSKVIIHNKDIKLAKNAIYIPEKNKETFVIYGYPGSAVEEYAKNSKVTFKDVNEIEEDENNDTENEQEGGSTDNEKKEGNKEDDEIADENNNKQDNDNKQNEADKTQYIGKNDFIWGEDNYNFTNSWDYFNSYYIGDLVNNIDDLYYEYFADNWRDSYWSGSCKGISDTAVLFKYGYFTKEKWQVGSSAETVNQLVNVSQNNRLLWLINFYQVFQGPIRNRFEKTDVKGLPEVEGFVNGLLQYYQRGKEEKLLICEYSGNDEYGNRIGHSVVITGTPEVLSEKFKTESNHVFDEYYYRIPVYDSNIQEKIYFYVKKDFSNIVYGTEDRIISFKEIFGGATENMTINLIAGYSVNASKVLNIEKIADNGEIANLNDSWIYNGEGFSGSAYVQNQANANIKVTNSDGKYAIIKDIKKVEGDLECTVSPILKDNKEGNSVVTNSFITLNDGEGYSIETEGENEGLNSQLILKKSYMTVETEGKAKANFEDGKAIELTNVDGKEYSVKLTVNKEDTTLPYNTLVLSGTDTKDLKLELTEQGAIVTGDNLKNLKAVAKDSKNAEKQELDLGTDGKSVLIKSDNNKEILAYTDKDGNGTFETILSGNNGKESNVKNAQTGDNIEQVMICVFGAYMMLIFMEFVVCVRMKN